MISAHWFHPLKSLSAAIHNRTLYFIFTRSRSRRRWRRWSTYSRRAQQKPCTFSSLMSCGEQMCPFPICCGKIIGRDRCVTSPFCAKLPFSPHQCTYIRTHTNVAVKHKTREQRVRRPRSHKFPLSPAEVFTPGNELRHFFNGCLARHHRLVPSTRATERTRVVVSRSCSAGGRPVI
jgi:hypothetical protein